MEFYIGVRRNKEEDRGPKLYSYEQKDNSLKEEIIWCLISTLWISSLPGRSCLELPVEYSGGHPNPLSSVTKGC